MEENKLFEALLDVIPFAAYAVDVDTYEVVYANKQMCENMFAPREEFCWKKLFGQEEVCSWCNIPDLKQREAVYKSEKLVTCFFDESTDKWLQSYDELVRWPDGRTVKYSIAVDITEQKEIQASMIQTNTKLAVQSKKLQEANKKLEFMATKDFLTSVNNRGNFFNLSKKALENSLDKNIPFYAVMFDLDEFKKVNDTFGHAVGDIVLKEFAKTVESNIDHNDIFGRLGGEEFALVIQNKSEQDVISNLQKIKNDVEKLDINHNNCHVDITVSIGFEKLQSGDNLDILLDRVDKQLYHSKQNGRNMISFRGIKC